ncbi:MAG: hypothetical protein U0836_00625 [Pirellulales bacterium]
MKRLAFCTLCAALLGLVLVPRPLPASPGAEPAGLVVHEWGTFTSLQDEQGKALPGINIDDEPLPSFVHNLHPHVLTRPYVLTHPDMKGAPQRHPDVTMRLETPVIYFHPAAGAPRPQSLNVDVSFRGGWLTEFYPAAKADAPGLEAGKFTFGPITPETLGSLAWHGLQVGTDRPGPQTEEHVWTAPRQVNAASVTSAGGESEKYLFYRGVGRIDSPLRVVTDLATNTLYLRSQAGELAAKQPLPVPAAWLVHVRADGQAAWRSLPAVELTQDRERNLASTSAGFAEKEFGGDRLDELRSSMHAALVADGLFADEATAMLETWRRAYFQSPGLRVFYLVPRAWTDHTLPLELSAPAHVERVMVGRIELISPEQRASLAKLASGPKTNANWLQLVYVSPNANRFFEGRADFGDLGVKIPADYQTYLDLGRFRNALVIDAERKQPTETLRTFIDMYGLWLFRPENQ